MSAAFESAHGVPVSMKLQIRKYIEISMPQNLHGDRALFTFSMSHEWAVTQLHLVTGDDPPRRRHAFHDALRH